MKTKANILFLPILLSILFTSCFHDLFVEGNREVLEEVRTVPDFTKISSSGSFDIYYEYAEDIEVTVSCESNLIMYIETVVLNDELKIRTPNNISIRAHEPIEIFVKGPYVTSIQLSGSGLIHTDSIFSEKLHLGTSGTGHIETAFIGGDLSTSISGSGEIHAYADCDLAEANISGTGKVYIEGQALKADFSISGTGKVYAYDFPVNELFINVSGTGDLYVNALDYLETSISGFAYVYYLGTPELKTTISGDGEVINQN
ncbi:MAG: head GIN domain-containing protein [Prolixibacteraceae bacterium]